MQEEREQRRGIAGQSVEFSEALYNAVSANDVVELQQLLELGASPDQFYDDDHNISSKSILHIACGKGHTECVR